ncbi:MAG: hypothetical protein WCP03_04075, partial [Candidatus Saccharibacteria bacterium]
MAKAKQVPTQDQDFIDILTNTFKLIGASWEALKLNFWTLTLVTIVPLFVFLLAIPFAFVPILVDGNGRILTIALAVAAFVAAIFLACLFFPAVTITQLESVRGNKVGFKEVFDRSKGMALPYLGLAIIVGLTILFGFVLLIIPGLIAIFMLSMAMFIYVDKKPGVIEAYKQSFALVKENILIVLAMFVVNIGVSAVSNVPFIGWIISLVLSVAYFCLPAIIYNKISKK